MTKNNFAERFAKMTGIESVEIEGVPSGNGFIRRRDTSSWYLIAIKPLNECLVTCVLVPPFDVSVPIECPELLLWYRELEEVCVYRKDNDRETKTAK